jgi:hypothetical protein
MLAIFEKMTVSVAPASIVNFNIGPVTTDLLTAATIGRLDSRGRQSTALTVTNQNTTVTIVGGTTFFSISPLTTTLFDLISFEDEEITLLPGDALTVVTNNINTSLVVSALWRERALEESERF